MLAECSIVPLGIGDRPADVLSIVDAGGLQHKINPLGTVIERRIGKPLKK